VSIAELADVQQEIFFLQKKRFLSFFTNKKWDYLFWFAIYSFPR
jgi:hypothetical protein